MYEFLKDVVRVILMVLLSNHIMKGRVWEPFLMDLPLITHLCSIVQSPTWLEAYLTLLGPG